MKINIINKSTHDLPNYETIASAGMDLRANIDQDIILKPLERHIIPTGLFMALPVGFEAQVRPRSGLASRHGVTVLNSPGTIDADYRGEIGVILVNLSDTDFIIQNGERVAQIVIAKHERTIWNTVQSLSKTSRGAGGFWISKGKIAQPISEATIAGNLKDMLMNITRANDIDMRDSTAAPSLRIDGMTVAGS